MQITIYVILKCVIIDTSTREIDFNDTK